MIKVLEDKLRKLEKGEWLNVDNILKYQKVDTETVAVYKYGYVNDEANYMTWYWSHTRRLK